MHELLKEVFPYLTVVEVDALVGELHECHCQRAAQTRASSYDSLQSSSSGGGSRSRTQQQDDEGEDAYEEEPPPGHGGELLPSMCGIASVDDASRRLSRVSSSKGTPFC